MNLHDYVLTEDAWSTRAGGRMLIYLGPPMRESLPPELVREVLRRRRAWAAMWSYDFDNGIEGPWYSLVCSIPDYNLDCLDKKVRYYVRRGLKNCAVRPVTADWLADHAYQTFVNAAARYRDFVIPPQESFQQFMRSLTTRQNYEWYGVFVGEQLAAYGLAILLGNTVNVGVAKYDPAYQDACPMYALYYTIASTYLAGGRFAYVDNGTRPIHHDTNMEDFLRRLQWRRAYSRLALQMVPAMRAALWLGRRLRGSARRLLPANLSTALESLLTAQDYAAQTAPR